MGLVLLVILVALPLGALLGERGGRILGHRLNSPWLLIAAFAAQLAEPLSDHRISYPTLMLVSAVLMIQFALRNRRVAGIPLAALGLLLNTVVVVGNGAMPVEEHAVVRAGLPAQTLAAASDARHEPADAQTKLRALGDRIAVPIPGHREIDSLGDLALAAGAGLFSFELTYRRRRVFDPTLSLRLLRA
ncbi:MAG TPA: DUF5317 domain-containing protein [Sporichthyaceae bacterium]|nr:DUF5317 domain-containing protein [Sporichthyaceae bacterium]